MSKNVLIIGYGVVGTNLHKELDRLNVEIYDKYKEIDTRTKNHYDLAFVCVDTPLTEETDNDVSEVFNAVRDNNADYFVLKSTVLIGMTEKVANETGKQVVFSPEYYGNTQHNQNFNFNFTILGGEPEWCVGVQQILQDNFDARHTFRITDAKTAELTKYMENAWLAVKVSFMQEFWETANEIGVLYEDLREMFVLDPRVHPSHTFVYADKPYWQSHCLDKDVPAIANAYDMELLKATIEINEKRKNKYKL